MGLGFRLSDAGLNFGREGVDLEVLKFLVDARPSLHRAFKFSQARPPNPPTFATSGKRTLKYSLCYLVAEEGEPHPASNIGSSESSLFASITTHKTVLVC